MNTEIEKMARELANQYFGFPNDYQTLSSRSLAELILNSRLVKEFEKVKEELNVSTLELHDLSHCLFEIRQLFKDEPVGFIVNKIKEIQSQLSTAKARVVELEKDHKRVDWLIRNSMDSVSDVKPTLYATDSIKINGLRLAIDAAMKGKAND